MKNVLYTKIQRFNPHSVGIDFSRQILKSKVDPHTVRVKIFVMAADSLHSYSNESE